MFCFLLISQTDYDCPQTGKQLLVYCSLFVKLPVTGTDRAMIKYHRIINSDPQGESTASLSALNSWKLKLEKINLIRWKLWLCKYKLCFVSSRRFLLRVIIVILIIIIMVTDCDVLSACFYHFLLILYIWLENLTPSGCKEPLHVVAPLLTWIQGINIYSAINVRGKYFSLVFKNNNEKSEISSFCERVESLLDPIYTI